MTKKKGEDNSNNKSTLQTQQQKRKGGEKRKKKHERNPLFLLRCRSACSVERKKELCPSLFLLHVAPLYFTILLFFFFAPFPYLVAEKKKGGYTS